MSIPTTEPTTTTTPANDRKSPEPTLLDLSAIPNGPSPNFVWSQDYDDKIEKAAGDNLVGDWEWLPMRDAMKKRIHQIVSTYVTEEAAHVKPPNGVGPEATLVDIGQPQPDPQTITISPAAIEQRPSTQHGLILPPFPRRQPDSKLQPAHLTVEEANEELDHVFEMLNEFDDAPPFTVQRICELLTRPGMYKSLGKFLRALDRTLLVTSGANQYTVDTFGGQASTSPLADGGNFSDSALKLSMTPLFSPIPFLHPDMDPITGQPVKNGSAAAPPSPMMLNGDDAPPPSPRLGLVDELDDPSADSNHLADHPRAISSTTNVRRVVDIDDVDMDEADLFGSSMDLGFSPTASGAVSEFRPLNERFVRSSTPEPEMSRALFEKDREDRVTNGRPTEKEEKEVEKEVKKEEEEVVKKDEAVPMEGVEKSEPAAGSAEEKKVETAK